MHASPRRRLLALLRRDIPLLTWLRVLCFVVVFWGELAIYRIALFRCSWPDRRLSSSSSAEPTRILILSDPQIRRPTARKHGCFFPGLHDWFYHAGLRRSWKYASRLHPDAVVFLGDMLAAGQKIRDDDEYVENYLKFRHVFPVDKSILIFHVPGNEDIGLNLDEEDARHAQRRYSAHFGPLNSAVSISNFSLVFIDAPGLVEEDYRRARQHGSKDYRDYNGPEGGAVDFIRSFASGDFDNPEQPIILFSHIPLLRPDGASCGPLRERGTIRRGAGPGYQNTFGKHTSELLLETLKPVLIFSGDDRDYCEYTHVFRSEEHNTTLAAREVTVKSFSPDKRIHNPGFHLLSLVPPQSITPTPDDMLSQPFADAPCFLPSQERIYRYLYLPCSILALVLLLARRVRERYDRPHRSPLPSYRLGHGPAMLDGALSRREGAPSAFQKPDGKSQRAQRKPLRGARRKDSATSPVPARTSVFSSAIARILAPLGHGWTKSSQTSATAVQTGWWHQCCSLLRIVALDFVSAIWPAVLLWTALLWTTFH